MRRLIHFTHNYRPAELFGFNHAFGASAVRFLACRAELSVLSSGERGRFNVGGSLGPIDPLQRCSCSPLVSSFSSSSVLFRWGGSIGPIVFLPSLSFVQSGRVGPIGPHTTACFADNRAFTVFDRASARRRATSSRRSYWTSCSRKLVFGFATLRRLTTASNAASNDKCCAFMRYAMTTDTERLTPLLQCTRMRPTRHTRSAWPLQ